MIDITKLSYEQLVQFNNQIIDRLNYLDERREQQAMLSFNMGERVVFNCRHGNEVEGIISKFNKKTVVVVTSDGRRWKVSPGFLRKPQNKQLPI